MIASQLEVVDQARTYLLQADKAEYTEVISPFFLSSAGAHMRHIIEHYFLLKNGLTEGLVDYDKRNRGGSIELDPAQALQAITEITQWLTSLEKQDGEIFTQPLAVSTEVSLSKRVVQQVPSSLARELVFVGSHAVHHFAMIGQIVKHQESETRIRLPSAFGVAPATASFLRENNVANVN